MFFNFQQHKFLSFTAIIILSLALLWFLIYQESWQAEPKPVHLWGGSLMSAPPTVHSSSSDYQCTYRFEMAFQASTSAYRQCLLDKLKNKSKWQELHNAISACLGEALWRLMNVHHLRNTDDIKMIILPPLNSTHSHANGSFDCVEVTLGVGNDIEAEKQLKDLMPHCRFYGADPILASGEVFKAMGSYHQVAVASTAGFMEASVLVDGGYKMQNVSAVSLQDFLINYAKVDHVDFLFLDAEGAEYGIFDQFHSNGEIKNDSVSICQISVEMHGPLSQHKMENRFDDLIANTINSSSYLPIWSSHEAWHMRSFYVNTQDRYCIDTFFAGKYCG